MVVLVGAAKQWLPDLKALAQKLTVNAGNEPARMSAGDLEKGQGRDSRADRNGIKEGAKLELDGRDISVPGYEQGKLSADPVLGRDHRMQIYTQEIFGPCWWCVEFETLDQDAWSTPTRSVTAQVCSPRAVRRRCVNSRRKSMLASRHQHPIPVPCRSSAFRFTRFETRRPRPYGKQVVQFYTQTKTVTARGSMTKRQRRREHYYQPALRNVP